MSTLQTYVNDAKSPVGHREPQRPALPGAGKSGAFVPATIPAPPAANNAAYVTRYGAPSAAIKAIMEDLHGADFQDLYWRQRKAFNRYLRKGQEFLDREEWSLLKQIVLTPQHVEQAIQQGMDDVKAIKAAMVEAIDTLGGFAVPVDFSTRLISRIAGFSVVRARAMVNQTSRDQVEVPVSTGGDDQYTSAVRVKWVDEKPASGISETNMTFGLEGIPIHTVMATTELGRNMVEDAAFNIENYLVAKLAEAAGIDEDNKFLVGNGVGAPEGILPGGTNALGLAEKVSGHASLLTWDGLIDMTFGIGAQYRQNAVWVGKRSTYQAIAKLKDTNFGYLWTPYQNVGGQANVMQPLMGYSPLEQEIMPSVGAGAYPLIFGDLQGYQIYDRIGMTVERYLDSATAEQNMIKYVMRRRLGGQVVEPWRFCVQKIAAS
jgi:HK97 family phage major capsid protein